MKEKLRNFIEFNSLFKREDKILLAISGGLDSVVLLHFLVNEGYNVVAAHCNFKLRGSESDEDELFVSQLTDKLGVKLYIERFSTLEYAEKNKLSIQIAARQLRYNWFDKLIETYNIDKLAVAHHLDDNIETLFINLLRGSGLAGIKGIPVKNKKIVRPLMCVYRKEISEYSKINKIDFREDSSNKSKKYLRNKIRHELIPILKNIDPSSSDTIAKSMSHLADDDNIFNQLIEEKRNEILEFKDESIFLPHKKLLNLHPLNSWVYRILKPYEFSRNVCHSICEGFGKQQSGKVYFSETYRLVNDRNHFIIQRINTEEEKGEFEILSDQKEIKEPINLEFFVNKNEDGIEFSHDKNIAYFDFNKLTFPLKLRRWREGDKFKPFGLKGNKLLSDFFINQKLSIPEKEKVWILCSSEKIIWVVGLRPSDNFKVTKSTKEILKVKFTQKVSGICKECNK